MLVIRGRLTPEVGAVVQRALDAAADRLFRDAPDRPAEQPAAEQTSAVQRRADALGMLAESVLASDLDRGTAGHRYQVVLHVEGSALQRAAGPGRDKVEQAVLDDGPYVSAETSQRLACDASVVMMSHGPDGRPFDAAPGPPLWNHEAPPLAPTAARLTSAGIVIGPKTALPFWHGEAFNVGYAIDVLRHGEERDRRARSVAAEVSSPEHLA